MKKPALALIFVLTVGLFSAASFNPKNGKETGVNKQPSGSVETQFVAAKGATALQPAHIESDSLINEFNRALEKFNSKDYVAAIHIWYGILPGLVAERNYADYIISAQNISAAYSNLKKLDLLLDWKKHALEFALSKNEIASVENCFDDLVKTYYNDFSTGAPALKYTKEALTYFKKVGDTAAVAKYQGWEDEINQFQEAVTAKIKEDENLKKNETAPDKLAEYSLRLGGFYSFIGDYEKGRDNYLTALKLNGENGPDSVASDALFGLTNLDMVVKHLRDTKFTALWQVPSSGSIIKLFSLQKIDYVTADSAVILVNGGKYDNILPESKVEIWACIYPSLPDHNVYHLANGKILESGDYTTKVGVKILAPDKPQRKVFVVDYAYIRVAVPEQEPSPVKMVAGYGVNYYDFGRNQLYSSNVLNKINDKKIERKINRIFLDDFEEVADAVDDLVKKDPENYGNADRGTFKGLNSAEAVRKSTAENVDDFFMYINDFPGTYLGLSKRFVDDYFGWIASETPAGKTKISKLILKAQNEEELKKIFYTDSSSIRKNNMVQDFTDSSDALYPIGELEKAGKYSLAAVSFADWLGDRDLMKSAWLSRGLYLKQIQGQKGVLEAYYKSLGYAKELNDRPYIAIDYHNIAVFLSDAEKYEEAISYFDSSIAVRKTIIKESPSDWNWERLGSSYWGKAYALSGLDKYGEAVECYELSLAAYDSSKSSTNFEDKIVVMRNIADVYTKMGNNRRAMEIYEQVLKIATELNITDREAQAYFDIGYALFALGEYKNAISYYEKSYSKYLELQQYDDAGLCQSNIGQSEWNLGNFVKAIEAHNKSIELRERSGNKADQAFSYDKLGALYTQQGDADKAMECFTKALELYQMQNDESGMAVVYDDIGAMYKKLNNFQKTFEYLNKSLELKEKLKDKFAIAANYSEQGLAYMSFNDVQNSQIWLQKSLELNLVLNNKLDAIYCMLNLGQLQYGYRSNFDSAMVLFDDALAMSKELNFKSTTAYAYKQIGNLFVEKGESAKSNKYLDSALTIYTEMQEKAEIGNVYIALASAAISGGNFDKAMEYLYQAEEVAKSMNNNFLLANAYNMKGDLKRLLGDYKEAIQIFDSASVYYSKENNPWLIASMAISYGNIYNSQGEYRQAISQYLIADSIYTAQNNDYYRSTPLNNIGTIYFWQGDYDVSLPYFYKTLAILDSIKYFGDFRATVLSNIGEVLYEQKKYDESEKYLLLAVQHAQKNNSKTYLTTPYGLLASLNIERNNLPEAEKWAKKAMDLSEELKDRGDLLSTSLILGRLNHKKNNVTVSNRFLDQAISLSKELGTNKLIYQAYYYKAMNFQNEKNSDSSITYLKFAVNVLNDIRGKLFGGDKAAKLFQSGDMKVKIYEALINAFIQKGQLDSALYYLDMSYNEGLKEQFGNVTPKFNDKTDNEAVEKEKELKNKKEGLEEQLQKEKAKPAELQNSEKIASLEAGLEVAENDYVEFIMNTVQKNPGLDDYFKDNINPVSFLEWQEYIPDDVAVLAYLMGDNNLYIFGATNDTVGAVVMDIKKDELEQKLTEFYSMLKDSYAAKEIGEIDIDSFTPKDKSMDTEDEMYLAPQRELSMELYQILVAPVKSMFKGKKKLCIVPFGKLYYLPFETLISSKKGENVKFLIEDHLVFYVTSFKVFSQSMNKTAAPIQLVAFANADNSLPSAETEVAKLKGLFSDAEIYSRNDATEDILRSIPKGKYNMLHFATHGNMNYGEITKSFLTMAKKGTGDDPKNDGQLTINEVWGLTNLRNFQLVTLSACKTAVSEEFSKGWLVSPANAFLRIGVQTVVASLWQVEDEATSILMSEFYSNLKTMSKSEALQKAKLKLIKNPKYAFPYYWAPFIMVGDYK